MKNNEKAKTAAALKIENAGLRAQLKVLRDIRRTEGYVAILQSIIRWSALTTMCYFAYRAIEVIAGQSTFASVAVDVFGNIKVSVTLAWFLGVTGLIYGYAQRSLRRDTIERQQTRIIELEKLVDSRRTSSRLTTRGDTRPEDVI